MRKNSSISAKEAIHRKTANDRSAARTIRSGISGGRIGRSVAYRRSERPVIHAGIPVRNMFWTRSPWSAIEKDASTYYRNSKRGVVGERLLLDCL